MSHSIPRTATLGRRSPAGGSGIATGNRGLLRNEQLIIVQPHYDLLRDVEPLFGRTRAFTANVHRDFLTAFPQADVTVADDRWAWIGEPGGMLEKWVAMPREERTRLVSLPMGRLLVQDWEPTIQALLPPGSP